MPSKLPAGFHPDICLAVLNWNGRHHLEYLIPSLLEAAGKYPGKSRVLILDNCSSSEDISWIHQKFPQIETVLSPQNDFLFSYNWLLPMLSESVVVLLNNDLKVAPDFLQPLVLPFLDSSVFAVGARSLDWEGGRVTSAAYRLGNHHGWCYCDGFESNEPVYSLFGVGGFVAVDRVKFIQLGGFDRLYHPAYWEDVDLCLRAWLKGWKTVYQPNSSVYHREGGSWESDNTSKRHYLTTRSQYLFNSRNSIGVLGDLWRSFYLKVLSYQRYKSGDKVWIEAIKDARASWAKLGSGSKVARTYRVDIPPKLLQIGEKWSIG